jgi:hypothetical protein
VLAVAAERVVRIRIAGDIEAVRVREDVFVAVGGGVPQGNRLALADALAADLRVL